MMVDDLWLLQQFHQFAQQHDGSMSVSDAKVSVCDDDKTSCAMSLYGSSYSYQSAVRGWEGSVGGYVIEKEGRFDGDWVNMEGSDVEEVEVEVSEDDDEEEEEEDDIIDLSDDGFVNENTASSSTRNTPTPSSSLSLPSLPSQELVVVLVWLFSSLLSLGIMAGYAFKSTNNNSSNKKNKNNNNETSSTPSEHNNVTTVDEIPSPSPSKTTTISPQSAQKGDGGRDGSSSSRRRRSSLRSNKNNRNSL